MLSPAEAALTSFSIKHGRSSLSSNHCFTCTLRQPRLTEYSPIPFFASIQPGIPRPIPPICAGLIPAACTASVMESAIDWSVASVELVSVGSCIRLYIWPSASTTPAAIFVPPTSTPTTSGLLLLYWKEIGVCVIIHSLAQRDFLAVPFPLRTLSDVFLTTPVAQRESALDCVASRRLQIAA